MAHLMNTVPRAGAIEDIAQEVFTRMWARRCEYRGQAKFSTYLYSYVYLVCLEERRARIRQQMLAGGYLQSLLETGATVDSAATVVSRTENNTLLDHALSQLTAKQRSALGLYYGAHMSVPEAATAMGCSAKCFESRLTRGRMKLRFLLRAQSGVQQASALAHRKHLLVKKTEMIETIEFGDVIGRTAVGCHCVGRWQCCSCKLHVAVSGWEPLQRQPYRERASLLYWIGSD